MSTPTKAAFALALSMSLCATAQAVPLYFDFTATTIATGSPEAPVEGYVPGQPVIGGFAFETDRMVRTDYSTPVSYVQFLDLQPASPQPVAHFSYADREISWPAFAEYNYNSITYYDQCTAEPCLNVDSVSLYALSSEKTLAEIAAGFTGTYQAWSLGITFTGTTLDLFERDAVDLTSVLSLPLTEAVWGHFRERTFTCVSGVCQSAPRLLTYRLDSLNVVVGPRTPVPEPGTLALLAAALAGFGLLRRLRST